jgi:creatinine amidohydrolase
LTSADRRSLGELTFVEVSQRLQQTSILLLPLGAIEQHGAHLPLSTDLIIAEEFSRRMIARWGEAFDLWQLPSMALGLSREHDWAPGTLSLSIENFAALLRNLAREIARALPARNLVIVNGHGGNRGVLDNLMHELTGDFGLNTCTIHPFDLGGADSQANEVDVHGGKSETSVMLVVAPDLVRQAMIKAAAAPPDAQQAAALIFDRGASFPWRTDDKRLAANGVIGDAQAATAELGQAIIDRAIERCRSVLERVSENQRALTRRR